MTLDKKYESDMTIFKDLFDELFSSEIDCLFVIFYKLNKNENKEITLSFKELKNLSNYNNYVNAENFSNKLSLISKKLFSNNSFSLFDEFYIDKDKRYVRAVLNNKYHLFIENIFNDFNDYDIKYLTNMNSIYAKKVFILLKRYSYEDEIIFSIDKLRDLLGVPKRYSMGNFTQKAIYPIERNLNTYFKNFKIKRIRANIKNDTSKIIKLEFKFSNKGVKKGLKNNILDKNKEYTKKELKDFGIDIINQAEPIIGIYKAEIDLVGFYEKDGSFNTMIDQDKILWRLI